MISRYQPEDLKQIWSEYNKFNSWLEVEILTAEAFCELGEISKEEVVKIRNNAKFDINRIDELELELRHDVVSFTRSVSESLGDEKKWIHYGLTSTDVVDTAQGYRLAQANDIIEKCLIDFSQAVYEKAIEHKYTIQMGRTHGVHAELTTFGYKMLIFYDELQRHIKRFKDARKDVEIGKISGAVGTYANVPIFVQDFVCKNLNIASSLTSTQTLQRDRHAYYMATIANMGSTIEKIATEFRHLQRTELREVEEGFGKNQKGSSAMPHKKNPISSENVTGLARVLRGYSVTANENVALWHERDISHSSAERIILEDGTSLIVYMLRRITNVVKGLVVYPENMLKNIDATYNVFFSQKVMLTLVNNGYSRENAYDLVQPIAIKCFNEKIDFKNEIKPHVISVLSEEIFEECFNKDYHLKNIDEIFSRFEEVK